MSLNLKDNVSFSRRILKTNSSICAVSGDTYLISIPLDWNIGFIFRKNLYRKWNQLNQTTLFESVRHVKELLVEGKRYYWAEEHELIFIDPLEDAVNQIKKEIYT